jgi:predicted glycogen debranching enzyme
MKIQFDENVTHDFEEAIKKEWLETNGLGGWASSTITGAHTRRYHGLLVAATQPPVGRMVLLSKLDETIALDGARFELGCNRYPNAIHPQGFQYLKSFEKNFFPMFEYEAGGIRLRKTIAALHGENTTVVLYEVLAAPQDFYLELQPFVAARDFHSLAHANDFIRRDFSFENSVFRVRPYDGVPELLISVPGSNFESQPEWYRNFEYAVEQFRGLDFHEDLFNYGSFRINLKNGSKLGVIVSTLHPDDRDAFELVQKEKSRREGLFTNLPIQDEFAKTLALAADQFIVRRGEDLPAETGRRTIIAGYHWFADWGRDTMIALPGICLATRRFDDAKKILSVFAQSVSQGTLPNRFPDVGEQPEYNTVDATLWYFVAIYKYLQYTKDDAFVRDELLPVLQEIIAWHDRGTRYGIHVDEDGLLCAGEPGVQLTWMDAKIGDWVVTPRQGKAVEINALWYNALMIFAELSRRFNHEADAKLFAERAAKVKVRFLEVFWEEQNGYLYDWVEGAHRDSAKRPNQIFALSLPFPLIEGEKALKILKVVEEKLYTPVGLRSLSPDDSNYRPHYGGGPYERDSAYHQGTVWSWLLGPYITALVRVDGAAGRKRAAKVIENFKYHLSEAGVGTVSEIYEGIAPHGPRGCIAQAWSVGEILRAYVEDV